jgi:hypothetical protein
MASLFLAGIRIHGLGLTSEYGPDVCSQIAFAPLCALQK